MAEIRKNKMSNNTTSNQIPTPQPEQPDNEETRKRRFFFDEEEPTNVESTEPSFDEFNPTTPVVELKRGAIVINKKQKPLFTTPPLIIKESYLGLHGNLGTKEVKEDKNKARSHSIATGVPIEGTKVWK